jgi:hypothetical protein
MMWILTVYFVNWKPNGVFYQKNARISRLCQESERGSEVPCMIQMVSCGTFVVAIVYRLIGAAAQYKRDMNIQQACQLHIILVLLLMLQYRLMQEGLLKTCVSDCSLGGFDYMLWGFSGTEYRHFMIVIQYCSA